MVYQVEILNPEAKALLESLVRLRLIRFTSLDSPLPPDVAETRPSDSLGNPTPEQAEAIRRRVAEVASGKVKPVSAKTVKAKLIRKHGLQG